MQHTTPYVQRKGQILPFDYPFPICLVLLGSYDSLNCESFRLMGDSLTDLGTFNLV